MNNQNQTAAEGSKNAYIKALREEKIANGVKLKRGRPKTEGILIKEYLKLNMKI
jgi:hypothetical protein